MRPIQTLSASLVAAMLTVSLAANIPIAPDGDRTLEANASIKPAAPKTGENALEVIFTEASKPVTGLKLTSNVGMTNMDMGTAHPPIKETSPGHYTLKPMFLMNGPWRVTLVSTEPKFTVNFDMSAGGKEPWKPVKQTIKIAGATLPEQTKPAKEETPKTEPPKQEPAKQEPPKQEPPKQEPAKSEAQKVDPAKAGQDYGHDMAEMGHVATSLPQLKEKASYDWTGNEEWEVRTGFGKLEPMVRMMILMMVGGSGMEGMKMAPIAMDFDEANFSEGDAAAMKDTTGADTKSLNVDARLEKAAVGDNNISITIATKEGKQVKKAQITTAVAMTSMDMGTAHPVVKELGKGKYTVKANFSMVGPWRLTLTVTAPGAKPETYSFDFEAK